jgi:hypothetical protein
MRLTFDLPQCEMFEGGLHLLYGFCLSGSNKAIWRPGVLRVSDFVIPFSPTAASIRLAVAGDFFFIVDVDAGAAA